MIVTALLLPFLGSLAGKVAAKFLGSTTNSSTEKPPDGNFQALLDGRPASRTPTAANSASALAATDQARALAVGGGPQPGAASQNFARQAAAVYEEHQAP
jgi:hypothetical protein